MSLIIHILVVDLHNREQDDKCSFLCIFFCNLHGKCWSWSYTASTCPCPHDGPFDSVLKLYIKHTFPFFCCCGGGCAGGDGGGAGGGTARGDGTWRLLHMSSKEILLLHLQL